MTFIRSRSISWNVFEEFSNSKMWRWWKFVEARQSVVYIGIKCSKPVQRRECLPVFLFCYAFCKRPHSWNRIFLPRKLTRKWYWSRGWCFLCRKLRNLFVLEKIRMSEEENAKFAVKRKITFAELISWIICQRHTRWWIVEEITFLRRRRSFFLRRREEQR